MQKDTTEILQQLSTGNARFLEEQPSLPEEHSPSVAILACADARVEPSRIFAAEIGELFVVRNAGNVASEYARESLAFAAELGVNAIVVLGHTDCGAVKDALAADPELSASAAAIRAHLGNETSPDEAARAHARGTADKVAAAIRRDVPVIAALYQTETGEVEWLERGSRTSTGK